MALGPSSDGYNPADKFGLPPGADSVPERHSLGEIQQAIEAMMSRLSGGRSSDPTLAGRIAGNIHLAVNDPKNGLDVLLGNSTFERIVTEQAPKLSEAVNSPEVQRRAAEAELANHNISGTPLSERAMALLGLSQLGRGGTERTERAASGSSGDVRGADNSRGGGSQPLGYNMLSYESPQSLMRLNPTTFASTPFATQDHLNFDTFKMLRGYQFKGSEIHGGVQDAKEILGPKLDVNSGDGRAIVRDAAGLRHEAPKEAAHITQAMKAKKQVAESDPELQQAADELLTAKPGSPEERKAFDHMSKVMDRADAASGAGAAVSNPALSPTAKGYASDESARVEHAVARAATLLRAQHRGMTPAQARQAAEKWEADRLAHGGPQTLPTPASGRPAPAPAKPGEKHAALPATPSKQVAELDQAGKALTKAIEQKGGATAADIKVARDIEQKAAGTDGKTAAKTAAQDEVFASLDADKHEPETKSPVVAKAETAKPVDATAHNQAKPGPAKAAAKSANPAKTHTATLASKAKPSQLKA